MLCKPSWKVKPARFFLLISANWPLLREENKKAALRAQPWDSPRGQENASLCNFPLAARWLHGTRVWCCGPILLPPASQPQTCCELWQLPAASSKAQSTSAPLNQALFSLLPTPRVHRATQEHPDGCRDVCWLSGPPPAPRDGGSGCKLWGAVQHPKAGIWDPRASSLAAILPFFSLPQSPACTGTSRCDPARGDDAGAGAALVVPRGDSGQGDVPLAWAARCSHAAAAQAAVQGSPCCLSLLHCPWSLPSLVPAVPACCRRDSLSVDGSISPRSARLPHAMKPQSKCYRTPRVGKGQPSSWSWAGGGLGGLGEEEGGGGRKEAEF